MIKPIYGVMAEFDNPTALVNAARAAREKGYRKLDAYSPFPIEELSDALDLRKNRLPLIVLGGGIVGGLAGYLMQYYVTVWNFPINIGGRPLHSWPSYIVITFEMTMLGAIVATFAWFLKESGLLRKRDPSAPVPVLGPGGICLRVRCGRDAVAMAADTLRKAGAAVVTQRGTA